MRRHSLCTSFIVWLDQFREVSVLGSAVLVFLFGWLVNFLLILGVCQMYTNESTILRLIVASMLCALGGVFLLRFSLKGYLNLILGCGVMILSGMTAFGWRIGNLQCCAMFLLLRIQAL